ncbi:endolytic transglycosylase MltG [Ruminococcus flavefaciens]|uniref:endolytic transglycosylase MltG n=1 Tax=Ruminococcus flavefaciens TaxID=1265 RepID=UPI00031F5C25|nr:endolytic transglycosylase MltG [Ruminococcus flavefaciens]
MPDNKNNDVINDILNQLDNEKKRAEAETKASAEKTEDKMDKFVEKYSPSHEKPAEETRTIGDTAAEARHLREEKPVREAKPQSSEEPHHIRRAPADHDAERPHSRPAPPPTRSAAGAKRNNLHHKKKKKKRRSRLPGVLILTVFIFAVSICLSMVIIAFGRDMLGIGKSDTTKLIIVPEGANTEQISTLLHDEGIINSPKCFQMFAKMRKKNDVYIKGEHFVRPNMAYETIIKTLTNQVEEQKKKEAVDITFYEGGTLYDAAEKLEAEGVCNGSDFMFYFNSGEFGYRFEEYLPKTPPALRFADTRMEGYLFPDTYTFTKDMDPEQVCQKIYFNFDQKMTDERLEKIKSLNLTLDQVITMASIVQKEAPTREDMNHVAGVFWNRLEKPEETAGKLQSDPTTNYAEKVIRPHMTVKNNEILAAYDTYQGQGLPPGPICSPGLDAIDAVLEKMQTDDFYFVANIYTKETIFAKTYDEHLQNEAKVKADEKIIEEQRIAEEEAAAAAEANNE